MIINKRTHWQLAETKVDQQWNTYNQFDFEFF